MEFSSLKQVLTFSLQIIIMKFYVVILFVAFASAANAQGTMNVQTFIKDANGRYVDLKPSTGIEGSPFFSDKFVAARLTLGPNKYYVPSKLHLTENVVYFENEGREMISSLNVDKIEFFDSKTNQYTLTFRNGFPATGKNTTQTYYEVLDSGKASLLKHIGVRVRENRPYNSATVITIYEKDRSNFLFLNNNMVPIKKLSDVVDAMADKKPQVELFVAAKKLKVTKDDDLKALVSFYNKLQ